MPTLIQSILFTVSGAIIGAFIFGLWLAVLMHFYVLMYGEYPIDFFGASTLSNSTTFAFIGGLFFGILQGFVLSLLSKNFGDKTLSNNILISLIVTVTFIIILMVIKSFDVNPMYILSAFMNNFNDFAIMSLVLLAPSFITGTILSKLLVMIGSK